ncbi:hypothetical protein CDIK_3074 [Cucumispora dikerogammari]|nr:hypothetical protein CDIK_3074 [Cucumispora dikerogammari]
MSRVLKEMNYSRKRLVRVPEKRNSLRNIEARQIYARLIEQVSVNNLVFLDETGVNLHQTRNYSYSPINSKCYKLARADRETNISCLVTVKNLGVISYKIKDVSFVGEAFIDFINSVLVLISPHKQMTF